MIRCLLGVIVSFFYLQSAFSYQSSCSRYLGSREADPASIIENVSAIHGDYTDVEVDLIVPSPDPLVLSRFYSSRDTIQTATLGGWRFNPHCFLSVQRAPKGRGTFTTAEGKFERTYVYVGNPDGVILTYVGWVNTSNPSRRTLFTIDPEEEAVGLVNTAKGNISSWTNLKNNELYFDPQTSSFELLLCSGGKRFYAKHPSLGSYFITHEILPSGNKIFYEFDEKGQLTLIKETNASEKKVLAWMQIQYQGVVHIETSDGKLTNYYFQQDPSGVYLLTQVQSSHKPEVNYQYQIADNRALLSRKTLPEGRFVEIDYYSDRDNQHRVRSLTFPAGTGGEASMHFFYEDGHTEVNGPGSKKAVYQYDEDDRLTAILQYLNGSLYRIHRKTWGNGSDASHLISTSIEDANGNVFYYKTFTYDAKGNIVKEREFGNLTGANSTPLNIDEGQSSVETHVKTFSYFSGKKTYGFFQNDPKGTGIKYWYKKGTNLLVKKFILTRGSPDKEKEDDDSGIKRRYFYDYNEDAVLVRITIDDGYYEKEKQLYGVDERHITSISPKQNVPNVGAPEFIEEKYIDPKTKNEVLLKKTTYRFDSDGNIVSESIYDADEKQQYTVTRGYTNGLLAFETDPLGNEIHYSYDANRNLISENHSASRVSIDYGYDLRNRLIYCAEKEVRGDAFEMHATYDALGNKTSEIDRYGNQTLYEYDSLGRLTRATYPETRDGPHTSICPTYTYSYDLFDNQISVTDPKGRAITKTYNSRGNLSATYYFDGTSELFKYDPEGSLHRYLGREGLVQVYEYDYIGRLKHIEYYKRGSNGSDDGFKRKYYKYNAFHLTSEKDERGETATYTYDGAGRLATFNKSDQKVEFIYDSLGRIHGVKKYKSSSSYTLEIKEYDLLNRIVEERTEDERGTQLLKTRYVYNDAGKLTQIIGYPQNKASVLVEYGYDGFGRISKIINASNQITQIIYDDFYINELGQKTQKKIVIDPLGNQREEIYDLSSHLTKILKKDKSGRVLSVTESFYDCSENKVGEKSARSSSEGHLSHYESEWLFNQYNQLESITLGKESLQKCITSFEYNSYGDLVAKRNADSMQSLVYRYNTRGDINKISYKEGEKKFINLLAYDKKGNLTRVTFSPSQALNYSYDANDLLLTENVEDELGSYTVGFTYDGEGKIQTLKLPDGSSIAYSYQGPFVAKAMRLGKEGKELYQYKVVSRDLMGNILEEILPGYTGGRRQHWDHAGRRVEISTDFFQDKIPSGGYDAVENICLRETILDEEQYFTSYEYNALSQLVLEKGKEEHRYTFDSLGNRLKKDHSPYKVNELNQLIDAEDVSYTFDSNGNLATKKIGERTWTYQWNLFNQLISITNPDSSSITFTYDLSGKRLTKKVESKSSKSKVYRYFYLNDTEIGCLDENGAIIELKVPSDPNRPETSPCIAIEIKKGTYVPLHDLQNNVVCLIDHQRRKIVESYHFSAFGEEEITNARGRVTSDTSVGNPWRYRGKRVDSETGLICFGKRYYDPKVGRWISPDPVGNIDGPNLYAYARNNPIAYVDYFGLAAEINENKSNEFLDYFYGEYEPHCYCETHRDCKRGGDIGSAIVGMGYDAIDFILTNSRFQGSMQAFGGLAEAGVGAYATLETGGLAAPLGWPIFVHGLDQFVAGISATITGEPRDTVIIQLVQKTGISHDWVSFTDNVLNIGGIMCGSAVIRASRWVAFPNFRLPLAPEISTIDPNIVRFSQSSISKTFRDGTTIDNLAISLRNGATKINEMPPIRLVNQNNVLFTLDNRRLEAFRRAGMQIPYRMATPDEIASEAWKFSSKNWGISIKIKGN